MNLDELDTKQLIDVVRGRYGYDLSVYAPDSLRRRVRQAASCRGKERIADMIPDVAASYENFRHVLEQLSVSVSELFRDPATYQYFVQTVVPKFASQPYLKIWHAGCASGEEVYSTAILLREQGLLDRSLMFATDISIAALEKARRGILDKRALSNIVSRYRAAGGQHDVEDYFSFSRFNTVKVKSYLVDRVKFAHHDLSAHDDFSEVHLIFCRNVFIYFNESLRRRVTELFARSLYQDGVLILGRCETLPTDSQTFRPVDTQLKIYQRHGTTLGRSNVMSAQR